MRYINGQDLIPRELLDLLQDYVQGAYVYIPKREDAKRRWGEQTNYIMELKHRNKLIYQKYLEGVSTSNLISIFHLSSSSIRRIILQERRTCDFMNNQIPQILTNWNISGEISQIYSTAWDISNQYVLKIYEDLGLLKRNITMLHALHDSGIPVARIIPLSDGRDYLEYHESYCILMDKLPGKNLVNISQKPAVLSYQMGTVLGRLHLGFQRCEGRITFWNNSLLDELNGWIQESFLDNGWNYISREDFDDTVHTLSQLYDELPKQLIHRDVHFGNFLFDQGTFSGYIDFDLSQRNIRIFDIAYFLLGLLADKEYNKLSDDSWLIIVQETIRGYEEYISLLDYEKSALPTVMKCIELLFVAYFTNERDPARAKDAADIFNFVKTHTEMIRDHCK